VGGVATAAKPGQVVVLRVSVRADDLESFIARYSRHLDGDRIFIFTKSPQPVGTRVRFTLQLANGEQLIHGKGTVTRVQEAGNPRFPSGMELVFVALDDRSQTLVDFMLASREAEAPPIVRAVKETKAPPPLPPSPAPRVKPLTLPPPPDEPSKPDAKPESVIIAQSDTLTPIPPEPPKESEPAKEIEPPKEPPGEAEPKVVVAGETESAPEPQVPETQAMPVEAAPAMAEKWSEPLPPGPPAATADGNVPANPFSEISDNAIEYFVEWSLEQSTGRSPERTSHFSNVPMTLASSERAQSRRSLYFVGVGAFAVGLACGAVAVFLGVKQPAPPPKIAEPVVVQPPALPEPPPPSEAALSLVSRPAGASVTVDGKNAGTTPLNLKLPAGMHEIALTKDRYQRLVTSTNVPAELDLELKRPAAELRVDSTPPGADVKIAGSSRGKTPLVLKLSQYEKYDVVVQLAGARPYKKPIYLRAEKNAVKAILPKLGAR
jgi:uncharacterized protein (TIGR02266 family)